MRQRVMDALVRLKLRPIGVWTTPWQADSLLGALACSWARSYGQEALRRDFLDPWLASEPTFVISDAFPADALPVPAGVPLWWDWPLDKRKEVKKQRWMTMDDFCRVQRGERPDLEKLPVLIRNNVRLRNSISRTTETTGKRGELFEVPYSNLNGPDMHLTIYSRASQRGLDVLMQALEILGRTGYGADASVGHGGFEPEKAPRACPEFADVPAADGFISLSTCQPAATDPTDGFWRIFIKHGKLAPEFHEKAVFKRPQVMLEVGACFRTGCPPKPFYGTVIKSDRLLSNPAKTALAALDVRPVQAAFSLAVPMKWPPRLKDYPHHC